MGSAQASVTRRHPAPGRRQVRPAQTWLVLTPEHQVDTPAEWVGVDEHACQPATHPGDQPERAGQGARSGTPAPADDAHDDASWCPVGGGTASCSTNQPLGLGQERHLLRADGHGPLPDAGIVEVRPTTITSRRLGNPA